MANDLTEQALLDILDQAKGEQLTLNPRHMIVTPEGLANARQRAIDDPEFARRVREEFPDLADSLL